MSESLHAHLDLHIALVLAEEFYGYLLFFFSFFLGGNLTGLKAFF